MQSVKDIHNLYDVYCAEMEALGDLPLDYDEFLEQLLITSELENGCLVDELANYQQAAEMTHEKWCVERKKRIALDGAMLSLGVMLETGAIGRARLLLMSVKVWN